jgi:hypothetical protein
LIDKADFTPNILFNVDKLDYKSADESNNEATQKRKFNLRQKNTMISYSPGNIQISNLNNNEENKR